MGMQITYKVALEIATHEAIVRQAYKNAGDVWTWSIGLTSATGHQVERYIDNPQSLDHCLRVYIWALDNYAADVREVFQDVVLSEAQFTAALSFHWNTGKIKSASWPKLFKQGKRADARKAFMSFNKPASIIPRRQAECDLLFDDKWSQTGKITEYTRLKSDHSIDWRSAKQIDISKELRMAIQGDIPASDKVIVPGPVETVEVTKEVPVAPPKAVEKAEQAVASTRKGINWTSATTILGGIFGGSSAAVFGAPLSTILTWLAISVAGVALFLILGPFIIRRIKAILEELN